MTLVTSKRVSSTLKRLLAPSWLSLTIVPIDITFVNIAAVSPIPFRPLSCSIRSRGFQTLNPICHACQSLSIAYLCRKEPDAKHTAIRHFATSTPPAPKTPQSTPSFHITPRAAQHILSIIQAAKASPPTPDLPSAPIALRVAIDSGGCHGYQYKIQLVSSGPEAEDLVFLGEGGARVFVDDVSLPLLEGSTLDWVEELIGSSFQVINNPKASSSCGCKVSFGLNV